MIDKKKITRRKALAGIGMSPVLATWAFEDICHPNAPQTTIYNNAFFSGLLRVLDEQGALCTCTRFTDSERGFLTDQFLKMAPSTHLESAIFASVAAGAHAASWLMSRKVDIIDEYVRRKKGRRPLMPDHSLLSLTYLGMPQTYRMLVFREQVTKLIEKLTGLPSHKCDRIRKDLLEGRNSVNSARFRALVSPDYKHLTDMDYEVIDWNVNAYIWCFGPSYVWASTMVTRAEVP